MLRALLSLFVIFSMITSSLGQLELPRKSPRASTSYTIGLTDILIEYGSPAVKGREVWNELVGYNAVWRAGANEATIISFNTDVTIKGKSLKAGSYSFFMIPKESGRWTIIFNHVADQWGSYDYDSAEDALRADIEITINNAPVERLNYSILQQSDDEGIIRFSWEYVNLDVPVETNMLSHAMDNIQVALDETSEEQKWVIYAQAADFLKDYDDMITDAHNFALSSTDLFDHSWNWYVRAQIEYKLGKKRDAIRSAKTSIDVGEKNGLDDFFLNNKIMIEEKLQEWETN